MIAGAMQYEQSVDSDDPRHLALEEMFQSHRLLDFRFAHGTESYQTAIIELVPEHGYLVLDGLSPDSGNSRTLNEHEFSARTKLPFGEVSFTSSIVQRGGDDQSIYYKVPYPSEVKTPHRRREFRVKVPMTRALPFAFVSEDGVQLYGEVRDLSPNGFSARLAPGALDSPEDLQAQRGICELTLLDDQRINAVGEICHVAPGNHRVAPRIGVLFVDFDARTERALERCVARLDREQLRIR